MLNEDSLLRLSLFKIKCGSHVYTMLGFVFLWHDYKVIYPNLHAILWSLRITNTFVSFGFILTLVYQRVTVQEFFDIQKCHLDYNFKG